MSDPARLPADAPASLRKFVRCETDAASIDLSDLGWIPRPRGVPDALEPSVTVGDGATATTATIKVGYGPFIALELPASIVEGKLQIDTEQLGFGIGPNVDKWVNAFNETLNTNGKQLDEFSVDGTTISLTKRPVVAAGSDGSSIAPTASATTAGSGTKITKPQPEPQPEQSSGSGRLAWVGGALAAVAVAVGIGVVVTNSDDDSATDETIEIITTDTPNAATPSTATPTTATPTTTSAPTTPPNPTTTVEVASSGRDPDLSLCAVFIGSESDLLPTLFSHGELRTPSGPCDPGIDAPTVPAPCDPELFACSIGQAPALGIVGNGTGVDHSVGFGDGASTLEEQFFFYFYGTTTNPFATVATTCGGRPSTADHPIQDGEVTILPGPLYSYGPCDASTVTVDVDGVRYHYPAATPFVVGDPEPDPIPPRIDGLTATRSDIALDRSWTDDVNTVNNTLGGRMALDETCTWFFEPAAVEHVVRVLDQCQTPETNHFWVFAAANSDVDITVTDTIVATTASYVNPLGQAAPPLTDVEAFRTSGPLFDDSLFPCGFGFHAYTVCAPDEADMNAGGFVTVSAAFVGDVPLEADGTSRAHAVDFTATGGGRYTLEQDGDAWSIAWSDGATRARALISGNSITLAIPSDELPEGALTYRWSSEIDGVALDQPEIPVVGVITTPTLDAEPPAEPEPEPEPNSEPAPSTPTTTETLPDFFAQLSSSLAAGDLGFALDRLDPRVFEVYPDSCPSALASFTDPDLVLEIVEEGPAEAWTYEAAGRSIEVPDAITVTVRLTGRGQAGEPAESHVTIIDGTYRWFTFC